MVRRALRSRSLRKVAVRTPGGRVVTHYRKRRPNPARCSESGEVLSGVTRARRMETLSKGQKRPQRPFGGVLGSAAMRKVFRSRARKGGSDV